MVIVAISKITSVLTTTVSSLKTNDPDGYSDDVKRLCIRMYVNGLGFRSMSAIAYRRRMG
jgi:hypothetical protein